MKKRFIFSLNEGLYKKARRHAFVRNVSMSMYVNEAIMDRINKEDSQSGEAKVDKDFPYYILDENQ
jgi:hypothetical protein